MADRAVRSARSAYALGVIALALFCGLIALGTWQVQRRVWKLNLIAQVDARLKAPPIPAPGPALWSRIGKADAYTRVRAQGRYIAGHDTLVQAATARGAGWWVMTPLRTDAGFTVLVNRGFVPTRSYRPSAGPATVTGLLRVTEPKGGFLRTNDPARDAWYSRDVPAIATRRSLGTTAPYFVDADATPGPAGTPVGGLTVIAFPNNHLVYALTWYGLALMVVGGYGLLLRDQWRRRRFADTPAA